LISGCLFVFCRELWQHDTAASLFIRYYFRVVFCSVSGFAAWFRYMDVTSLFFFFVFVDSFFRVFVGTGLVFFLSVLTPHCAGVG